MSVGLGGCLDDSADTSLPAVRPGDSEEGVPEEFPLDLTFNRSVSSAGIGIEITPDASVDCTVNATLSGEFGEAPGTAGAILARTDETLVTSVAGDDGTVHTEDRRFSVSSLVRGEHWRLRVGFEGDLSGNASWILGGHQLGPWEKEPAVGLHADCSGGGSSAHLFGGPAFRVFLPPDYSGGVGGDLLGAGSGNILDGERLNFLGPEIRFRGFFASLTRGPASPASVADVRLEHPTGVERWEVRPGTEARYLGFDGRPGFYNVSLTQASAEAMPPILVFLSGDSYPSAGPLLSALNESR